MKPEYALRLISRLSPGSMLDVGARDGRMSHRFAELGYRVHAIDPMPTEQLEQSNCISFAQSRLEDYAPERHFDLVLASCVSHLVRYDTASFFKKLKSLTAPGGLIFVTLIGRDDDWAKHDWARATDVETAIMLGREFGLRALYRTSECFDGRLYDGTPKFWNLLSFVFEVPDDKRPAMQD